MIIQKEIRILVVDDDKVILTLLERFFKSKNLPVVTIESPIEAARLLKTDNFEIVILDVNMPILNGFELLLWMKKNKIQTNTIIITDNYSEAMQKSFSQYGILRFMSKPVNLESLLWTVNIIRNEGFISKVTEISLFDYIQMSSFTKKDIIISVNSVSNNQPSLIYIKQGEIIHAIHENLKGEEAFFKIMAIKGGNFSESVFDEPTEISVKMPTSALIFRAGEVIDEENMKKISLLSPDLQKIKNPDALYRVLITDNDENIRNLISDFLNKQAGIYVETSGSAAYTAKLLQEKLFDLAIIDINIPEVNGFELLLWMKKNNIDIKTILMSDEDSEETKNYALQQGAVKFFHKSSTIQDLFEFIRQDNLTGFTGTVSKISIFDYVQMIMLSRKNKFIFVHSPLTNFEGQVYFKNGSVIHAVLGDLKGKDAFFKIVAIKGGIISEVPWKEPPEISISGPSNSLLFKATQYLDQELSKLDELKIDDNIVKIIDDKINNTDLSDRTKYTTSGSFIKPEPVPPAPLPQKLKLTSFFKAQSSLKANTPTFANTAKQKPNIYEEELKHFDSMKYILPILTKGGENVLSDPKTPMGTYQLLKKFDGKNTLENIYESYYYHISINDFFSKLDNLKNCFKFMKSSNTPVDKELEGKIIQILIYLKFLDPKELVKKINDDNFSSEGIVGSLSGEILLKFELIKEEQLKEALAFQKRFNLIIENLAT